MLYSITISLENAQLKQTCIALEDEKNALLFAQSKTLAAIDQVLNNLYQTESSISDANILNDLKDQFVHAEKTIMLLVTEIQALKSNTELITANHQVEMDRCKHQATEYAQHVTFLATKMSNEVNKVCCFLY